MEKRIVYRVHFTKLTKNLNQLVKSLTKKKSEDLERVKNLKINSQLCAYLYAMHSKAMKEEEIIRKQSLKNIEEFLLRHIMIDDKSELLFENIDLTDIETEDPDGYFIKFIFS